MDINAIRMHSRPSFGVLVHTHHELRKVEFADCRCGRLAWVCTVLQSMLVDVLLNLLESVTLLQLFYAIGGCTTIAKPIV